MASMKKHFATQARARLAKACSLATLAALHTAQAQDSAKPEPAATEQVTVSATKDLAGVTGFGNLPLSNVPMQVGVTTAEQMKDLGIRRLSDIAKIDASVGDGYNADGYYDFLTVRGFVIDNRFNYLRDGLPISGETSIPLDNKSRVEVLKGTAGMQSGIGSPGGMVNLVVKRPTDVPLREVFVGWRQSGSVLASTDLSDRFGERREFGLRLNAAYENIDPQVYVADGDRYLLSLAGDWRVNADAVLEAEIENSRRSQPSAPGFSVLGSRVPEPGNPRINLNNQPWSQPNVFNATTASLRWRQRLDEQWSWTAQAVTQQLKTDDYLAFPYGCSAENVYDRYCSDGTYDMYDYRSQNERRRNNVVDLALNGALHHRHAAPCADRRAAVRPGQQPLPAPGLQLRRHRQCRGHADRAGRARADRRKHPARRQKHRSLRARRHRHRRADHAVARPSIHPAKRRHGAHRRQRGHRHQPELQCAMGWH